MSFMDSIKSSFSRFAQFSGRASKQEWMYFFLLYIGVGIILGTADGLVDSKIA